MKTILSFNPISATSGFSVDDNNDVIVSADVFRDGNFEFAGAYV